MEIVIYLMKSAGILTLFYLTYYFVLGKDTFFTANRHFLIGGIIAAVILPFVQFTSVSYIDAPLQAATDFMITTTIPYPINESISSPINWWQVAVAIYLIGAIIMVSKLLIQLFSLLNLIRKYPSVKNGSYVFVEVDDLISPFSFFKYIIYNPNFHSQEELEMILKHEEVHASEWHSFDIILANLIRIFQWVNPFSWLYKKSLEQNLEFIADSKTAQIVASKKEYQLALVKASSALIVPALTNNFYQSFIKKRIIMLNKNTSKRQNLWKLFIVLPALALFLWSFNVKEVTKYHDVATVNSTSETSDPDKKNNGFLQERIAISEPFNQNKKIDNRKENITKQNIQRIQVQNTEGANSQSKINVYSRSISSTNDKKIVDQYIRLNGDGDRYKITKNTTDAELDEIKAKLKSEHNVDFKYDVTRNSNQEIIAISISYSSKGNNGSYNIHDDEAIEDFYFYFDPEGKSGFMSGNHQKRSLERGKYHEERNLIRAQKRLAEQEMRHVERKVYKEKRHMEGQKRQMQERKLYELKRHSDLKKRLVERDLYRSDRGQNNYSYGRSYRRVGPHTIVNKNTTDEELTHIKSELAAEGISFSYSRVKRNSRGEISRIKIVINNGKGSKTTISEQGENGNAIDDIRIEN